MLRKIAYILIVLLLIFSCEKQEKTKDVSENTRDSIAFNKNKKAIKRHVKLLPNTKREIKDWKEYQYFNDFIKQFYNISSGEALASSVELSDLATHLKDSIIDDRLKKSAVKTRFNVLQSECLRLKDMESIIAIEPDEVQIKVSEILVAFDALNAKLNSVYVVESFEDNLKLDPDFKKILFESGIDTITKKEEKNLRDSESKSRRVKYNRKISKKKREKEEKAQKKIPSQGILGIPFPTSPQKK